MCRFNCRYCWDESIVRVPHVGSEQRLAKNHQRSMHGRANLGGLTVRAIAKSQQGNTYCMTLSWHGMACGFAKKGTGKRKQEAVLARRLFLFSLVRHAAFHPCPSFFLSAPQGKGDSERTMGRTRGIQANLTCRQPRSESVLKCRARHWMQL